MVRSAKMAAALVGASCAVALAAKCSLGNKCPQDSPCCSQYGECGVGAYCLGGCDARMSFSLDSCVPAPVCRSTTTKFDSLDSIVDINKYLGDASKADWVAQGEPAQLGGSVLLTMPRKSVGTVLASTRYMWYGNVKAKLKTSRGRGVVTAFILLSDVKDEIDYEFVGADLQTAQTNYYFQGVPDYHNSGNVSLSDTFYNFHEYEIRWTPDKIEWLVDGQVGRVKNRRDTWNETTQQWKFPQTPARVQLSIWPGGLASNAKGTIDWAGGEIDWDGEDVKKAGYYYATVSEVSMECYDAKTAPGTHKGKSYTYNDARGTNDTVVDGGKDTMIGSLEASGLDPNKGKQKPSSSSSSSSSSTGSTDKPKQTQNSIPGGSNGSQGQDHSSEGKGKSGSPGNGGSGSGGDGGDSGSSQPGGSSGCDNKSFSQNCAGSSSSSDQGKDGGRSGSTKTSASALAMIIAGAALFWL